MEPEEKARLTIDKMLEDAGYVLQDMAGLNREAAMGVAVRGYPTNSGPMDYLLFVDGQPAGVVEAKEEGKGYNLTNVAEQSLRYATSGLKHWLGKPGLRFTYESTGVRTRFCDLADEEARSREVYSFHRPETLLDWLNDESTLRNRLKTLPHFDARGFRACQTAAIQNLEESFANNKPRALIQMATGAGKTFAAVTAAYRLLKHAKARRILFLVDTKNLGEQAEGEFRNYKPNDDARLFPELYNVCRLRSSFIPKDAKACISTIQRMYSILRGEALDDAAEELDDAAEQESKPLGKPKEVAYNKDYPPEFFDFVVVDECHRSIYNVWQQVLDYFDAFLIGLTATPDSRTFAFFNENIVSEYSHEQAVLDGVNVPREGTWVIETQVGSQGGVILKDTVEVRERLSRKKRWEQLDEDVDYEPSQLDRDIVNPSQIRCVIKEFKKKWPEMFLGRNELPKTLIFAKSDSHADDIINIVREEFGQGNDFCKKVTYRSAEDPSRVLRDFRIELGPRIAVTVNMIAAGTDVKPIECLVFMRDVRSKNYFEQMLGRATRTLGAEDLQRVSPSAMHQKTGYILVDAAGVVKSKKTNSRQFESKPSLSLEQLMKAVSMGACDLGTVTSLAGRLIKLDRVMEPKEKESFAKICKTPLIEMAANMLNAFDEDQIGKKVREVHGEYVSPEAPEYAKYAAKASEEMAKAACKPINRPEVRDFLRDMHKCHFQIIDDLNIDAVTFSDWGENKEQQAQETIETFAKFIQDNRSKIDALKIIYSQSYKNRPLTLEMVKELYGLLTRASLPPQKLWAAYSVCQPEKVKAKSVVNQLADIISLVRFQLGQTMELYPFSADVARRFKEWTFEWQKGARKFTEEQMNWLRDIRDHIAESMYMPPEHLELSPFDGKGGLGKFHQLFGSGCEEMLADMNYALMAV